MGYKKRFEPVYEYLLDCMHPDELDDDAPAEDRMRVFGEKFLVEGCDDWKRREWPNVRERVREYLMGIPSCCSTDYTTYDIFLRGQEWGYVSKDITTDLLSEILSHRDASEWNAKWWDFLSFRLMEMVDYYGIKIW